MADLVSELNSLDFGIYIGGPLQAAVNAQNSASLAQVEFINSVGLTPIDVNNQNAPRDLIYANFEFSHDDGGTPVTRSIKVPLLTMLNIPSIRIEEITIDFNAKLTSVETETASDSLSASGTLSAGCKFASLKVSAAYKRTTTKGSNVEKTYSMAVHVSAVNDELPAGLDRILTLLENEIKSEDK